MKKFLSIFLLLLISFVAFSQSGFNANDLLKPRTGKQELVNDFTGTLTQDQKQALENKLVQFDDSTSTQIVVVIVPNIGGDEIADYNLKLGRAWGVGGKEFNNGVVLLISKEDRKLNIATGYGVEGALPDVTCKQIIDQIIVPNFKGNDYYAGISQGTDAIMQATKGEFKAPENYNKRGKSSGSGLIKIVFFVIIIIVFLAISSGGRGGGGGSMMSNTGAFILGNLIGGGGRGGGFGGGGGGGSSGGGGFGGFGGGSFGGGGSSGSW